MTEEKEPSFKALPVRILSPTPVRSLYCRRCSRRLSAAASIRHGYGSKCWKKVARKLGVSEEAGAPEPCTITDEAEAAMVRREIRKRLFAKARPDEYPRWVCGCGRDLREGDLLSMDHDAGEVLKGYGAPQWFYIQCECGYGMAIWKIRRINLSDLEAPGAHHEPTGPSRWGREGGENMEEDAVAREVAERLPPHLTTLPEDPVEVAIRKVEEARGPVGAAAYAVIVHEAHKAERRAPTTLSPGVDRGRLDLKIGLDEVSP